MQRTQRGKKCRIRFMKLVVIEKASQEKQQNQAILTTNINYIQTIVHLKKLLTSSK